jgi:hypothetical protein
MGKDSEKTQTTENAPPAWAAPLFQKSASDAMDIYNSGKGGNVYQGQTVAPLGATTQAGIAGVQNAAGAFNDPAYRNMLMGSTSSASNLGDMASGKFLQEGNPYFNAALQGQLDNTAAQTQSQFSGAGRYGSGANTNALATSLGNIRSSALSDQFNRDTSNMLTANSQIDAANQGQLGLINNANNSNLAAQQAVTTAGGLQDANAQKQLSADYAKWQSEDMLPWTRLGLLQSAAAGSAGNYGTNTQTQTQSGNPFQTVGALGSLASAFLK